MKTGTFTAQHPNCDVDDSALNLIVTEPMSIEEHATVLQRYISNCYITLLIFQLANSDNQLVRYWPAVA